MPPYTASSYHSYRHVRFYTYILNALQDILPTLKRKDRKWSMTRLYNVSALFFIQQFAKMSDKELDELFENYQALLDEEREGEKK